MKKISIPTKKLTLAAMLLSIGFILPSITGHVQLIGNMLLPMHLPVFIAAYLLGWQYAAVLGAVLPISRALFFPVPPLYPTAIAMSFELVAYGIFAYVFYCLFKKKGIFSVYASLIISMLIGRLVWGLVSFLLYSFKGNSFSFSMFLSGAFINAVPGIIIQLILIPAIVLAVKKAYKNE